MSRAGTSHRSWHTLSAGKRMAFQNQSWSIQCLPSRDIPTPCLHLLALFVKHLLRSHPFKQNSLKGVKTKQQTQDVCMSPNHWYDMLGDLHILACNHDF
jgi:hypothetical protein